MPEPTGGGRLVQGPASHAVTQTPGPSGRHAPDPVAAKVAQAREGEGGRAEIPDHAAPPELVPTSPRTRCTCREGGAMRGQVLSREPMVTSHT